MKNLIAFIMVVIASYGGYRYWNAQHQKAQVIVIEQTPVNTPSGPRLSPEGTYFLLDYYGVHTDHGVIGWTPGQQVRAVSGKQSEVDKRWVSDGQLQAQVDEALLTRDIDLAARLGSTDSTMQASAAQQALTARDQQMAAEKRVQAEAARAEALASRQRARTIHTAASTPANPLDRDARPTNGGRQVSRAPDIPNAYTLPQTTSSH